MSMNNVVIHALLLICCFSGGILKSVQAQKTWCVAKPSSDAATLMANINYACSQVDCRVLTRGCPCFSPDNLINHASIAMNLYYQCRGRNHWNCDFKNSALVTVTDPRNMSTMEEQQNSLPNMLLVGKTPTCFISSNVDDHDKKKTAISLPFFFSFGTCVNPNGLDEFQIVHNIVQEPLAPCSYITHISH